MFLLWSVVLTGCDSGHGGDVAGNVPAPNSPRAPQPNPTLRVNLDPAGAGIGGLEQYRVIAYDIRGAELAEQTVPRGQDANFEDLPAGAIEVRVIGLGPDDEVLGFSDVSAAIPNDTEVDAAPLTPSGTLPPPATPGTAFLAFTGLPAVFEPGVSYSIEVSAFNAQGLLDTTANGSVGLSSSGASAVMPEIGVLFNSGRATFSSLTFPQGTNGTVTFTASAVGFQSATSPTLPVRSN